MTTFDDRERGFEAKFALDETQRFQAIARRDRMLGEWIGQKMGLTGTELDTYSRSVLRADLQHPGHEDVIEAVMTDIARHDLKITEADLRAKLADFHAQAEAAVHAGT